MDPWYKAGLSFQCTHCGRCCGGSPGVVWVDREEIRRIAQFIEVAPDSMWGRLLRRVGVSRVSLVERANGDCVFLRRLPDGSISCVIYPIRPQQCRTWPFWNQNLHSRAAWQGAGRNCPGIDHGRGYDLAQIESIRLAGPWHQQPEDERHDAAT